MNARTKTRDAEHVQKPKRKSEKQSVKFCPKCGSTNVFWASGLPQLWSIWECRNCGYRGALILEDSRLAEKLKKNMEEKSLNNRVTCISPVFSDVSSSVSAFSFFSI